MPSEKLVRIDMSESTPKFQVIEEVSRKSINLQDADIEEWIMTHPELLFPDQSSVLIFYQAQPGEPIPDTLALDVEGNLMIIDAKRDWSSWRTTGQLIDYAATLSAWDYESYNSRSKRHFGDDVDLIEHFRTFTGNRSFQIDDLFQRQRIYLISHDSDTRLQNIFEWLSKHDVPIELVPFHTLQDSGGSIYLRINQINIEPLEQQAEWAGDWFLNVSAEDGIEAYNRMIQQSTIAVAGLDNAEEILSEPSEGDRVFIYVKGMGLTAMGHFADEGPFASNTVFYQDEKEYHRKVTKLATLPSENALSLAAANTMGCELPVHSAFAKFYNPDVVNMISELFNDTNGDTNGDEQNTPKVYRGEPFGGKASITT